MCWGIVTWPLVVMRIRPAPSCRPKPGGISADMGITRQSNTSTNTATRRRCPPWLLHCLRRRSSRRSSLLNPSFSSIVAFTLRTSNFSSASRRLSRPMRSRCAGSPASISIASAGASGLVCAVPDHGLPAAGGVCGDHGAAGGEGLQHGEWGPFRVGGEDVDGGLGQSGADVLQAAGELQHSFLFPAPDGVGRKGAWALIYPPHQAAAGLGIPLLHPAAGFCV